MSLTPKQLDRGRLNAEVVRALGAWFESQDIPTGLAITSMVELLGILAGQRESSRDKLDELIEIFSTGIRIRAIAEQAGVEQEKRSKS